MSPGRPSGCRKWSAGPRRSGQRAGWRRILRITGAPGRKTGCPPGRSCRGLIDSGVPFSPGRVLVPLCRLLGRRSTTSAPQEAADRWRKRFDPEPAAGSRSGRAPPSKAPFFVGFYRSAIGKKYVMAITGIVFMLYVFAHMFGNLKMYHGARPVRPLRRVPPARSSYPILPDRRLPLDLPRRADRVPDPPRPRGLVAHGAEPQGPARRSTRRPAPTWPPTSPAARCAGPASSCWSSSFFHLGDLTWGWFNPDYVYGDVYDNVVDQPRAGAGRDPLHRRQPGPRRPPVPRRLEHLPEPRLEQPPLQRLAPLVRAWRSPP